MLGSIVRYGVFARGFSFCNECVSGAIWMVGGDCKKVCI